MIPDIPAFIDLFKPDKLVHLFVFAVFVFLMLNGFFKDPGLVRFRSLLIPVALNIGLLFSGITEVIQKFWIFGRVASVYDFIANVAGCLIGWWVFNIFTAGTQRRRD